MNSRTERALLSAAVFAVLIVFVLGSPTNRFESDPNPPAFQEVLNLRPPSGHIDSIAEPEPTKDVMPSLADRTWSDYAVLFGTAALCMFAVIVLYILHRYLTAFCAKNRRRRCQEKVELQSKTESQEESEEIADNDESQ